MPKEKKREDLKNEASAKGSFTAGTVGANGDGEQSLRERGESVRAPRIDLDGEIRRRELDSLAQKGTASFSGDAAAKASDRRAVTEIEIRQAADFLRKYKKGKANLEEKIVENEQFWKLRHWESRAKGRKPATAWLWSAIVGKHADMENAYPTPSFLPRAKDDEEEAKRLSAIVPVILDIAEFDETYSDCCWYKLKQGAAVYGVFWNGKLHGGLGDIDIRKIDLLELFWEPGITDIQSSKYVFHTALVDKDALKAAYPEAAEHTEGDTGVVTHYLYDDTIDTSDKALVVDWYYHDKSGRLQLCKFTGGTILFASENEPERYPDGWYAHGKFPFVVDSLYDIEGSICGYSYTDIHKDTQIQLDSMSDALVKNTILASKPRFFYRRDSGLNVSEYADLSKELVEVEGNLAEDAIKPIRTDAVSGNCISMYTAKVDELKDTAGHQDVSRGATPSGITAASAIAALQEAAGKTSQDAIKTTYRAFKRVMHLVIELIREKYDVPRQFRIIGEDAAAKSEFVFYSNEGLKAQRQQDVFGTSTGYRLPEFDIAVSAAKSGTYNRMENNELALQFYGKGFFNPQNADVALACIELMEFDKKDKVVEIISRNSVMHDKLMYFAQIAYMLSRQYAPELCVQMLPAIEQLGITSSAGFADVGDLNVSEEYKTVSDARARAEQSTQPN